MRLQAILLCALVLLSGCATAPPSDVAALQRDFQAEYGALKVPDLGPAYAKNFEAVPSVEALAERTRVLSAWRSRFVGLPRSSLPREARARYDTLLNEMDLNLERARLETRYAQARPTAIPTDGLSKLPDAREWYALYLARNASNGMSPDSLFAFGETEVARIHGEMRRIQAQQGFTGKDAEWRERLRSGVFTDRAKVERELERVRDTVQAALPKYFAADVRPPVIKPVPDPTKDTPPGYYANGEFFYSFYGNRFPARSVGWLYLHEGVPGHHYQLTLHPIAGSTLWYPASVEGWGAYCEDLGTELGVYADPYIHYGKWEWDLVRSARVVLDVGIHDRGWSRDRALAYWRENLPGQEDIAEREVDRVTRWPAQVVSYKAGEKAILELRSEFARRQGSAFDIRDFHARVLELGIVPITVLERSLRESLG